MILLPCLAAAGWALVSIDTQQRTVRLLHKDPANPRNFTLPGRIAARCGGTLASDVRFGGHPAELYTSKVPMNASSEPYRMAVVLGEDARFLRPVAGSNRELSGGLAPELLVSATACARLLSLLRFHTDWVVADGEVSKVRGR